jgi:dipeptidyl aminopeptidase/acylaminoacyl peptidase
MNFLEVYQPVRTVSLLLILVLLGVAGGSAQLPPLIDRELFFGDPEISGSQISPDGRMISFLKPFKGVRNIWVRSIAEAFDKARPVTADTTRPVLSYFWSRDGKYLLYAQDKGGDENYRVYAVDPLAPGEPVPQSRDLTPVAKVRAEIIDVPKNTPNEIIVGLNDRRSDLHDAYRLNIVTGERVLLRKNDDNIAGWVTDLTGALRLGIRQTPSGGTEILRLDNEALSTIYSVSADETCLPVRFSKDGKTFYLQTDKGSIDKSQLEIFDLTTGLTTLVEKDPKDEVDFERALFSDVTDELLATLYVGDRVRVYPKQKQFAEDYARMIRALPDGEVSISNMTADESVWMVAVYGDVDPGSRYLYYRKTGKAELLYRSRPNLPMNYLAALKPVRYPARDGMTIPAYLAAPRGVPAQNLPAVILIHGGPWVRVAWGYNAEAQFLANRGYAVLIPNFRGSTGYGKKFLNAGNKQWGTGGMQHDISDGVQWLIKQRIADPKRVAIYGGSYGGYATLAGLAFTPDLYAAGVSYVGPSNIVTLLKSIPPYWAPMKKLFAVRVGDIGDATDLKMLEAQSPLNSARNIKAPLLVVQGANDPRVKKAESDQIVVALRDLGRTVEYMVAPDEGHGFTGRDNRLGMYTALERFFAKHIGGRFQESIPPEIQKKIDALTVDVKTVTVPERPSVGQSAPAAVFQASKMKPDRLTYTSTFAAMGQKMTMLTLRTITAINQGGKEVWRIVDATSGAMGSATDTVDIDAASLVTIRRAVQQGSGGMVLDFSSGGVKGRVSGPGMDMPIEAKSPGPLVSDGAGLEVPLCTLPLAENYRATVNIFDFGSRKVRAMALAVSRTENVTIPAGSFAAFVVEARPTDGESGAMKFWVSRERPRVVKSESEIPASMGGGMVTTELTK